MGDVGFFGEAEEAAGGVQGLVSGGARRGFGAEGEDEHATLVEGGLPRGLDFKVFDASGAAPDYGACSAKQDVAGVNFDGGLEGAGHGCAGVSEGTGFVMRGENAVGVAAAGAEEGDFVVF